MGQIDITLQPQSQRAPEGSPVVLSCRAVGPVELTYQWFKGKDEVWCTKFVADPADLKSYP